MVTYVIFGLQLFTILLACFIGYIAVISKREEDQAKREKTHRQNHRSPTQPRTSDST